MKSKSLVSISVTIFLSAAAVWAVGCAPELPDDVKIGGGTGGAGPANTGGAVGSGGASATGGAPASGGAPAATGGASTGGATNTGGAATGGRGAGNTGGANATGGAGTGGRGTGGAPATGGGAAGMMGNAGGTGTTGTFAEVSALLTTACASCHNGMNHTDLRAAGLHARIVAKAPMPSTNAMCTSQMLVVAGNPAMSLLLSKVKGTTLGGCGAKMPAMCTTGGARPCLTAPQIATIESWIMAGAPM
ncbi:MAG: hypothetical protein ABUS79_02265 [Pseudomonadota bacterium]